MSDKVSAEFPANYFKYFFEHLPEGVWIEDEKGQISYANKHLAGLTGFRSQWEIIGKTFRELILPNETQWIDEYMRSSKQYPKTFETLLKSPAGPLSIKLHILPFKEEGKIIGRAYVVVVVEKDKKTDVKAKTISNPWQEVIENSIDGICIIKNHTLSFANRRLEEMTGHSAGVLKSHGLENIITPRDRRKIEKIIHAPHSVIVPVHYEVKLYTKHKREIDTELRVVPIRQDKDKSLICFFRDITQIKELEKTKTDFITTISHELRTPLTAIKEAISLLSNAAASKTQELPIRFIEIAKEEIGRLNRMIDNLVEVSRIESGKVKMRLEPVKIDLLIDTAVDSLEVLAIKKKIKMVKNLPKNLPTIPGDSDRIFHLISNILDNAIKFTPRNGTVTISAEKLPNNSPIIKTRRLSTHDEYIIVNITDTGPGIAQQNLERIFEKFERIEPPTGAGEVGIGLGLTIARNTVELHKGKIWVTSELNKGSTFSFVLPTSIRSG